MDRYEVMGQTLDDAAGEAFDKVARMIGLGFPGGPALDALARDGNPDAIRFPRAMEDSGDFDFSMSGLKTAVLRHVKAERAAGRDVDLPDLAASFQEAIVDVQVRKTIDGGSTDWGSAPCCSAAAWSRTPVSGSGWSATARPPACACCSRRSTCARTTEP